jgi:hypothetical protein
VNERTKLQPAQNLHELREMAQKLVQFGENGPQSPGYRRVIF